MNDLLTTRQLTELLHLDRTTIYRMLNDGRLPGVRVGGQWRFSSKAIETWLTDQKQPLGIEAKKAEQSADPSIVGTLPVYCMQPIQDIFAQATETGAVTTDLEGNQLIPVTNSCEFCNLILSSQQGMARCQASWKRLADQAQKQPRLEKCYAGLSYARGRVVVQNTFVAMVFAGQFVVDQATDVCDRNHIERLSMLCQVDESKLTQAAREIRILTNGRADRLLGLLQMMADTYSRIGEERLDLFNRLKQVAQIAQGVSS